VLFHHNYFCVLTNDIRSQNYREILIHLVEIPVVALVSGLVVHELTILKLNPDLSVHRDRQFTLFLVMIGYGRAIAINASRKR
jgi:uncharacterized membrane protein YGL010W